MPTAYFLTPPDIPEGLACRTLTMPSSLEWLGIFNSLLGYLTEEWRYIQENETDLTPAETVAKMKEIIDQYYWNSECGAVIQPGGEPIIGYDEFGKFKQLLEGGWGEPTGDYAVPPIPPRESGTDDEKKCLAAANATNVLKQLYEQLSDDYAGSLSEAEALSNLITFIALLVGAWLGLAIAAVIAIYRIMFQVVYETIEFVTSDYWTTEFDERLQCALYNAASVDAEGVVTFDMAVVVQKIAETTNIIEDPFQVLLFGQVQAMLNIIGTDGLNAAGATTAITSADCSGCPRERCYEWDFRDDPGMWSIVPGQPGSFTPGVGLEPGLVYVGGDPSRGRRQTIIQMTVPSGVALHAITGIAHSTIGNISATTPNGIWINNFATNLITLTPATGDINIGWGDPVTPVVPTTIEMSFAVGGCDGCGDPGGSGDMYRLQITGFWDGDPFTGGYACD